MTPLPFPLGQDELVAWRLDREKHRGSWDSGEGAFAVGGRWNSPGARAVYCSFDPATAILEVAVHKGFRILDVEPHVLTSLTIASSAKVHIVEPGDVPNPNWLHPGEPSAGQQEFGDNLLKRHPFIAIPSVVSSHSWNLIFSPVEAGEDYALRSQERFALDPRLHSSRSTSRP